MKRSQSTPIIKPLTMSQPQKESRICYFNENNVTFVGIINKHHLVKTYVNQEKRIILPNISIARIHAGIYKLLTSAMW